MHIYRNKIVLKSIILALIITILQNCTRFASKQSIARCFSLNKFLSRENEERKFAIDI